MKKSILYACAVLAIAGCAKDVDFQAPQNEADAAIKENVEKVELQCYA